MSPLFIEHLYIVTQIFKTKFYSVKSFVVISITLDHVIFFKCSVSVIITSNMDEKKTGWTTSSIDDLKFMASQGSQIFNTMELLGVEKIHDKLIIIGVAHLPSMSTKQCDIRSFFVSSERSLPDLNDTL